MAAQCSLLLSSVNACICAQVGIGSLGFRRCGPRAKAALSSVTALACLAGGQIVCGGRDGHLAVLDTMLTGDADHGRLSVCCTAQLPDAVSSIAISPPTNAISVGTLASGLFTVDYDEQVPSIPAGWQSAPQCREAPRISLCLLGWPEEDARTQSAHDSACKRHT